MADSFSEREKSVIIAKLADHAERYDEMTEEMKKVATTVVKLTEDERILLSSAYRKKLWPRRASWKILSSELEKEWDKKKADRITEYRNKVEAEMRDICYDILSILDNHLIPSSKVGDEHLPIAAYHYMMKGDYYGYLSEFEFGSAKKEAADEAIKAYECAMTITMDKLSPEDPIRLGVALNYSVFYYEILGLYESACEMAESAFDDSIFGLDLKTLNLEAYRDRDEIMQLLKDNVTAWKAAQSRCYSDDDNVPPYEVLSIRIL